MTKYQNLLIQQLRDNCGGEVSVTFAERREDGNCENSYTLIRTWTATDACGNNTTTSQTITVTDDKVPVLSGVPADVGGRLREKYQQ